MYIKANISLVEAKKVIENGGVVYTTEEDRGIGKTTAISAYSIWSGKPLVVKGRALARLYEERGVSVLGVNESLRGYRFENGVLVDDIPEEDYIKLRDYIMPHTPIAGFVISKDRNGVSE